MDTKKVIAALEIKYPGKRIIRNGRDAVTEIVCETEPATTPDGPGVAVAVIDSSAPHYHEKTTELYRVIEGELTIYVNEFPHRLQAGDEYTITPGKVHCAAGDETWVEVVSDPGWTPQDHFPAN
ncbi:MAG: cupin domain-containing protein [Candidatus Pacebacteria bacterium]|jgi:mannose-6-phosphate isomerase-like protein (cupin superfamily)|nr:cupin domain-containing protein [Candidatus Paceibacterota bacterium]